MSQPRWRLIQTLGDRGVPQYDGALLFVDEGGLYEPELECYIVDESARVDEEDARPVWVYRIIVEAGDNDWYMDKLEKVANYADYTEAENCLENDLLSGDPYRMAAAFYYALIPYYGYDEFDPCPRKITMREAEERVAKYDE